MEQHSNDQQTGLWARLKERAAAWNDPEARQQRGRRAGQRRRLARDWARIHLRRAAHRTHGTLAIQQAVGPASFLVVSAALGVGISQASAALSQFPEAVTMIFGKSPVVIATIMAVLLNLILPKEGK